MRSDGLRAVPQQTFVSSCLQRVAHPTFAFYEGEVATLRVLLTGCRGAHRRDDVGNARSFIEYNCSICSSGVHRVFLIPLDVCGLAASTFAGPCLDTARNLDRRNRCPRTTCGEAPTRPASGSDYPTPSSRVSPCLSCPHSGDANCSQPARSSSRWTFERARVQLARAAVDPATNRC